MTARRWYAHGDVESGLVFCVLHDSFELLSTFTDCIPRTCLTHTRKSVREHEDSAKWYRPKNAVNVLDLKAPCGAKSPCACRKK
jgi:hypothetical protein